MIVYAIICVYVNGLYIIFVVTVSATNIIVSVKYNGIIMNLKGYRKKR